MFALFVASEGEYVSCLTPEGGRGGYPDRTAAGVRVGVLGARERVWERCSVTLGYFGAVFNAAFNFPSALRLLLMLRLHTGLSAKRGSFLFLFNLVAEASLGVGARVGREVKCRILMRALRDHLFQLP